MNKIFLSVVIASRFGVAISGILKGIATLSLAMTATVIMTVIANAQLLELKPLAGYKLGSEWIIIDELGNKLYSSPFILDVEEYYEGLLGAYIRYGNNVVSAYFDNSGEIVLATDSRKPYSFRNGRAFIVQEVDAAKHEYIWGAINRAGKFVIPMNYIDITEFSEGLAYIMNLTERGFVDTNGKFVFKLDSGFAGYGFREGLSPVSDANIGKFAFVDKTGKVVIDYKFDEVGFFSEGLARAFSLNAQNKGAFGYINKSGNYVIDNQFEEASNFSEGLAFVAVLDITASHFLWAVINSDGVFISEFKFRDFKNFSEGFAAVRDEDLLWRYIDKTANFIDDNSYKFCGSFVDGKALVITVDDEKMFINKSGRKVIEIPVEAEIVFDFRTNEKYTGRIRN